MPFNPKRAGRIFGVAALLAIATVAGFYFYARYRVRSALHDIPVRLGVDIKQTTSGFTFSKSERGRTLFTVSAGKAVQFKGDHTQLSDVRIIVYGRGQPLNTPADQRRFDQIYGKEFDYDQKAGEVRATGEVHIDLEATGTPEPSGQNDPHRPGIAGVDSGVEGKLHLKTSGIVFNQKTAVAETDAAVEFAFPQANGRAVGAVYDSRAMALTLKSQVVLNATEESASKLRGAVIKADKAVITDLPRQIDMRAVTLEQKGGIQFAAEQANIYLRDDNTVERMLATGNVKLENTGGNAAKGSSTIRADRADLAFGAANLMKEAVISGNIHLDSTGASPMTGSAGTAKIEFAGKGRIAKVRASGGVNFQQLPPAAGSAKANIQTTQIEAEAMDLYFSGASNQLRSAITSGASQIVLHSAGAAPSKTVITAGGFDATFAARNHLKTLHGAPEAKIVSSVPNAADRVSTSRELDVQFDPGRHGQIASITQSGDFQFSDGQRSATADSGHYSPADENLVLTGSPRVQDKSSGLTITADNLRLNRKTGDAFAQKNVKTTYNDPKPNLAGAMLASAEPIHVTSRELAASRNSGRAHFSGGARLWQGANIVEAPVIDFDKNGRILQAGTGNQANARVKTSFVQTDKAGKQIPVNVTARRLTYSDGDRRAHFEDGVVARSSDATLHADRVDIILRQKGHSSNQPAAASQLESIVAEGNIRIEQQNPLRQAKGERLVFTAEGAKYVLTGSAGNPPSIFDAERGNVTGDSLTFFSHDDTVRVDSKDSSRTVTRTRISSEKKP